VAGRLVVRRSAVRAGRGDARVLDALLARASCAFWDSQQRWCLCGRQVFAFVQQEEISAATRGDEFASRSELTGTWGGVPRHLGQVRAERGRRPHVHLSGVAAGWARWAVVRAVL